MTTFDRQAVTECLSRLVTPGIKFTALADELGARKQDYAALRELMLDLVEEGAVQVLPGGAFALAPSGRAADPHGKPQPPPAARPELPTRKRRSDPSPKPAKAAARKPQLPWRPSKPAPTPPPNALREERREEYDPETGQIRLRTGSTVPPPTTPRSSPP